MKKTIGCFGSKVIVIPSACPANASPHGSRHKLARLRKHLHAWHPCSIADQALAVLSLAERYNGFGLGDLNLPNYYTVVCLYHSRRYILSLPHVRKPLMCVMEYDVRTYRSAIGIDAKPFRLLWLDRKGSLLCFISGSSTNPCSPRMTFGCVFSLRQGSAG